MNPKITVLTSLYNCKNYLNSFFKHVTQIEDSENIEILLLHNAPTEDEVAIINQNLPKIPSLKYHVIPILEGLYATWNRGIKMARGEYICIWNVDDIRLPASIRLQAATLDAHPEAALTYGDMGYMYSYGILSSDIDIAKDFKNNRWNFFRSHQIGCFPMWRKNIHEKIGYFDEQFKLIADFDFQIRVARNYDLVKTDTLLGYYLEYVPTKLSYSPHSKQRREQNVLYLRYGIWDKINSVYIIESICKYKIALHPSFRFPHHFRFVICRFPLIIGSLFRQPRYILAYIKHEILKK